MQYVKLGNTGLDVSRLCLGCMTFGDPDAGTHPWTLDVDQSRPIIRHAVEQGINFFDTANEYNKGKSEEILGRLAKDHRDERVRHCHDVTVPNCHDVTVQHHRDEVD